MQKKDKEQKQMQEEYTENTMERGIGGKNKH